MERYLTDLNVGMVCNYYYYNVCVEFHYKQIVHLEDEIIQEIHEVFQDTVFDNFLTELILPSFYIIWRLFKGYLIFLEA